MGGKLQRCMKRGIGARASAAAAGCAYALTAEFHTIASARTLAQLIACTCHIACVAWRCTRMSRGS